MVNEAQTAKEKWRSVRPYQVTKGDYVKFTDIHGAPVEGEVSKVIKIRHEEHCREIYLFQPGKNKLTCFFTESDVQVRSLDEQQMPGNFTASDGFEANI